MKKKLFGSVVALAVVLLSVAAPVSAATFSWTTGDPFGLFVGSSCGDGIVCGTASFQLTATSPSSGSLVLSDPVVAFTPNATVLSITLPSATFTSTSAVNGVDEVLFTDVTYTASITVLPIFDGTTWSLGLLPGPPATVTIAGTVTQLLGGGLVSGPTAFAEIAELSALACTSTDDLTAGGSFTGTCGFAVGGFSDFEVTIGGSPVAFIHTFNQTVPEPSLALLLGLGLVAAGARRRG